MTHHLTLSAASQHARVQGDEMAAGSDLAHAGDDEANLSAAVYSRSHLTLANTPVWRHRLILRGRLDYRSACELEEEIECLCEEGVTILTLDLRQLDAIDPTGATAVAFCGAACRKRGRNLAVIPGAGIVHHALTEAGATDLLTPDWNESVVRLSSGPCSDGFASDRSTTMINNL